ncbi:hypothetical protein BKA56DRAFT_675609 [Ilyonectria sp. MPI-CAGE-AT-0026]|nr:hypothetical protein BKA56DRAFT_675609 [Ilyonectria sp. MPI-CAGE-AT-0026]
MMDINRLIVLALTLTTAPLVVLAQQFRLSKYPYDLMKLSGGCLEALNTIVNCSDHLSSNVPGPDLFFETLEKEILDSVCMKSCRQSLFDLRSKIQLACEMDKRPFVYKHIEFPPTYRVDLLLLSYNTYCYKDKDTGRFCDLQIAEWRATPPKTPIECNDCMLGPEKLQLEAPIGYNEYDASDFSTSTSRCGVTGYEYSKPTQYATTNTKRLSMAWKPFTRPTPTPCLSPYIIKEDDDCESIARENSVSTHELQLKNHLWCHERLSPGVSICLPPKCKTHEVEYGDTCTGLSDRYGVSSQQLVSWNPIIDKKCSNIKGFSGTSICVGPPDGFVDDMDVGETSLKAP